MCLFRDNYRCCFNTVPRYLFLSFKSTCPNTLAEECWKRFFFGQEWPKILAYMYMGRRILNVQTTTKFNAYWYHKIVNVNIKTFLFQRKWMSWNQGWLVWKYKIPFCSILDLSAPMKSRFTLSYPCWVGFPMRNDFLWSVKLRKCYQYDIHWSWEM